MSAETRSWATAEDKRADLQQRLDTGKTVGPLPQAAEPKRQTVAQAIETFITAKQSEGASTGTIRKLRQQLGMLELIQFRAGWTWKSGVTRQKAQQNLRAFLRSCSKENLQELLGGH